MSQAIVILALHGSANAAVATPQDMLFACNRIARGANSSATPRFLVQTMAENGLVISNSGSRIKANLPLASISDDTMVVVAAPIVSSSVEIDRFIRQNKAAIDWLGEHSHKTRLVASHCAGVFALAEAGLLTAGACTTAWYLADEFSRRYPSIDVNERTMLQASGNVLTAGAGSAIQDLCLEIVAKSAGRHYARLLAKYFVLDSHRDMQSPYAILTNQRITDSVVAKAERWIHQHLASDFCIQDIADHVGVSNRTLIRRFRKDISISPQALAQSMRIEKSKILLEATDLPLTEIVVRVGYSDESAYRRLFARHVGLTPNVYRRRFSHASVTSRREDNLQTL
ncbi:MAG: helix-turn-helix domain-containing protein [Pseudomonadota bacterium]